jgi:hypothetical protein
LLALALCCGVPGCATRDAGYKISDETVAFIQPGTTTRSEVVENLGTPLFELRNPTVLAYSWGKVRPTGGNAAARQEAMQSRRMTFGSYETGPPPIDDTTLVETRRWVFCVELDEANRVTRTGRLKLEGAESLEQAVRRWASGTSGTR